MPRRNTRRQSTHSAASSIVDLTDEPDTMAPTTRAGAKRTRNQTAQNSQQQEAGSSSDVRAKRRRRSRASGGEEGDSITVRPSSSSQRTHVDLSQVEELDLTGDKNDELGTAMQKQRADQIAAQKPPEEKEKPMRLGNIQCVICMDSPTDLTATSCGHVFCHTCLMEALIAGERRGGPGETKRSQCPVCRKNINRNKSNDVIPLLMKKGDGLGVRSKRPVGWIIGDESDEGVSCSESEGSCSTVLSGIDEDAISEQGSPVRFPPLAYGRRGAMDLGDLWY